MKPVRRREWKDLAKKNYGGVSVAGDSKPHYPSLYLSSKQIGIQPIKAGEVVTLIIQANVTSINTSSNDKGDDSVSYSFDLKKLKIGPIIDQL